MPDPKPESREAELQAYQSDRVALFRDAENLRGPEDFKEGSKYYNWIKQGEKLAGSGYVAESVFQLDQAKVLLKSSCPEARAGAIQNLAAIEISLQYGETLPPGVTEEYETAMSDPDLAREVLEAANEMIG